MVQEGGREPGIGVWDRMGEGGKSVIEGPVMKVYVFVAREWG